MVFAKKKWGQNFLVDNNLLNKIVKTVNITSDENILEIGPGQGALSEKLVDICNESVSYTHLTLPTICSV